MDRCRTGPRGGSPRERLWFSVFGRPKHGKPGPPLHDDVYAVVNGRIQPLSAANAPHDLRLTDTTDTTDTTDHRTAEAKLYPRAITDVDPGRRVGYSVDSPMKSGLGLQALENAVAVRGYVAGLILHSDAGPQLSSRKMLPTPGNHSVIRNMGRVGSGGDNASMDSFSALLQKDILNLSAWTAREHLRIAMVTRIERILHRRRRQARLDRLTPIELEAVINTIVALQCDYTLSPIRAADPMEACWGRFESRLSSAGLTPPTRSTRAIHGWIDARYNPRYPHSATAPREYKASRNGRSRDTIDQELSRSPMQVSVWAGTDRRPSQLVDWADFVMRTHDFSCNLR